MRINKVWTASSDPEKAIDGDSLAGLVGQWNTDINVKITNPYKYTSGSIRVC
jgi:hypothetical protein